MGLNNYMPPENRKRQKVYPRIGLFYRSTRPDVFCKKGVLRNLGKFTGKRPCQNFYFNKVAGLACNFIKIETLAQVFSCEFAKFLRTPFLREQRLVLTNFWTTMYSLSNSCRHLANADAITNVKSKIIVSRRHFFVDVIYSAT